MMKSRSLIITLIVILIVIAVSLIGIMIKLMNNNFNFNWFSNYKEATELVVDETYEVELTNIDITSAASDIEIKESTDNRAQLMIYGEKDYVKYSQNESNLNIEVTNKPCFGICLNRLNAKIILYLPEHYLGKINIESNYGDVFIGEFKDTSITITSDAGDIKVRSANDIEINSKYGDIKIDETSTATLNADCGDIEIDKVNRIKVENHYGDITLKEVLEHVDVYADCGDIEINNLNLTENSKIENNMGDIEIGQTNEIYIDAKTSLGDENIKNNYRNSEIELNIRNSCGDIDVNN